MHYLFYKTVISHLPDKWVEKAGGVYYDIWSRMPFRKNYDIPTNIAGVNFPNPVGIPAGWIDTPRKLETTRRLGVGVPTIKTITYHPKKGNPYPRIIRDGRSIINSLGLPNHGLDWWMNEFEKPDFPIIISIKGDTLKEWTQLIESLEKKCDILELNLSCPNVGNGVMDIASSRDLVADICGITNHPVFLKLSPEFSPKQNLQLINVTRSMIDGITAINTLPTKNKTLGNPTKQGGISGPSIYGNLIDFLSNIRRTYQTMSELPVLATGGIFSGEQAWEVLHRYRAIPMGLTGMLVKGPNYHLELLEYIESKLNETDETVDSILETGD